MHYYLANAFNDELEKIARPHLLSGVKDKKRKQRLAMGLGLFGAVPLAVGLAGMAVRRPSTVKLLNRIAQARSKQRSVRISPRGAASTSTKNATKSTYDTYAIDSVLKKVEAKHKWREAQEAKALAGLVTEIGKHR